MKTAEVFEDEVGQLVRLPERFRFEGRTVAVSREGDQVVLEPVRDTAETPEARLARTREWFKRLDAIGPLEGFEAGWREQPRLGADGAAGD